MAKTRIPRSAPAIEFPSDEVLAEQIEDLSPALATVLLTTITLSHEGLTDGYYDKRSETQKHSPALPAFKILNALKGIDLGMPFREAMLKLQLSGHILQRGGAYIPAIFDDGKSSKLRRAEVTDDTTAKVNNTIDRLMALKRKSA